MLGFVDRDETKDVLALANSTGFLKSRFSRRDDAWQTKRAYRVLADAYSGTEVYLYIRA